MRRVPTPLLAVMLLAAVQAVAWAIVLPPLQAQDEPAHVAYAQKIVEQRSIAWSVFVDPDDDQQQYSTELERAEAYSGSGLTALNVAARPYRTAIDVARWREVEAEITPEERADGGFTNAMRNPPLYYLYEAAVYAPMGGGTDLFTRLYVMRLATVPFLLISVLAAWLLAGEVFGRRRWLQAVTALTVALQPMLAQLAGIVNPDAMIAAVVGVGLWLAAVIVNRGATRGRVVGAIALTAAAGLTHPRALPLAVPLVAALLVRAWPRIRARGRRARVAALGLGAVVVAGLLGASVNVAVRGDLTFDNVRQFGSYIWQFYLPRPGFMDVTAGPDWGVRDVFVDRLWSGFVLLEVNLAPWVLDAISIFTMAGIVALLVTLVVRRDVVRPRLGLALVFATAPLALMWFLHVAAWRDLPEFGDPIITGRYLTPLLPLVGLGIAAVVTSLPRRFGPGIATLVLGIEALLAMSAIATAVVRFHV